MNKILLILFWLNASLLLIHLHKTNQPVILTHDNKVYQGPDAQTDVVILHPSTTFRDARPRDLPKARTMGLGGPLMPVLFSNT